MTQNYGRSTCKSADAHADACADPNTDWCSYVLYEPSFRNSADADADADQSILGIIHFYCDWQ